MVVEKVWVFYSIGSKVVMPKQGHFLPDRNAATQDIVNRPGTKNPGTVRSDIGVGRDEGSIYPGLAYTNVWVIGIVEVEGRTGKRAILQELVQDGFQPDGMGIADILERGPKGSPSQDMGCLFQVPGAGIGLQAAHNGAHSFCGDRARWL